MLTERAISVTGIILGSSLVAVAIAGEVTDCQTSVTRKGGDLAHWSWRTIDGKQCWYAGRPGMSKANLHWRTATVGQRGPAEPDRALAAAVEWDTDVVQRNAADNAQPERQLTFRERWPY